MNTENIENVDPRYHEWVETAATSLIAVADEFGISLVDVIAETERYIIEKTKVGDAAGKSVEPGRRGYTLRNGRLVEV